VSDLTAVDGSPTKEDERTDAVSSSQAGACRWHVDVRRTRSPERKRPEAGG